MPSADLTLEDLVGAVHPLLHRLRSETPVVWVPVLQRWLVTDRRCVLAAVRDSTTFTVDDSRFTTATVVGPSMLSLDGPEHQRHREPFALPFRRSASIADFSSSTVATAHRLVSNIRVDRATDLRRELAAPLAAITISDALGLVDTTTADLLSWYREIVEAVEAVTAGEAPSPRVDDAMSALAAAVDRTRRVPDTLMARIDAGAALSPPELHSNVAVMLFGAIETSEGMIANALSHVLCGDDTVDRLRQDDALVDTAIEESLRLEPAATLVDRYVTAPTQLGEVTLPAGAAVALSLAGANRDPAYFENPDLFDLDRANASHHLSFVHGPHACIGMHLARIETAAALRAVLTRYRDPIIEDSAAAQPRGLVFRKPQSVMVSESVRPGSTSTSMS